MNKYGNLKQKGKKQQMKIEGAIFDMDGLLFDTENIYQETWNELAAENGVVLNEDFVGDICGTSGAHMCRVIEKHYGVSDGSIIMEECMKRVRQKLSVHVPKKQGTDRIIKAFHDRGVRIAVAKKLSTANRNRIFFFLRRTELAVLRKTVMFLRTVKMESGQERQPGVRQS